MEDDGGGLGITAPALWVPGLLLPGDVEGDGGELGGALSEIEDGDGTGPLFAGPVITVAEATDVVIGVQEKIVLRVD